MRDRTGNVCASRYDYYGARGISVCSEWNDFSTFRAWSLANGYADHLSIDRIDNNGNYEPRNCRWVTQMVQIDNSRPKASQKLTRAEARAIRSDRRENTILSKEYGVSSSTVGAIKRGKIWKEKS